MTKTARPATIQQTSGGKFVNFSSINNIKKDNDYAYCLVGGKSASTNRPSTLTLKKFNVGLPTGAWATKVTVEIKHSKAAYNNKNCNVPAPTVTLMNGSTPFKYKTGEKQAMSKKAKAPTTSPAVSKVTFNSGWDYSDVNSNDFGVKIDYPANTNSNQGYIRLYYVKVTITYNSARFTIIIRQLSGEYNGDTYGFFISVSNVNNVNYVPTLTIDIPAGFSLQGVTALGTFNSVSSRVFTWKPKLGRGMASDTIPILFNSNVTFSGTSESYTGTINVVESLAQNSASRTVTVLRYRPLDPTVDGADETSTDTTSNLVDDNIADITNPDILTFSPNQALDFDLTLDSSTLYGIYCCTVTNGDYNNYSLSSLSRVLKINWNGAISFNTYSSYNLTGAELLSDYSISITTVGNYVLVITDYSTGEILKAVFVDVKPSGASRPRFVVLPLTDEEIARLGDGYNYTVQSFMKVTSNENYIRNWGKNFKLGVFNNLIVDSSNTVTVMNLTGGEFSSGMFNVNLNLGDHYVLTTEKTITIDGVSGTVFEISASQFSLYLQPIQTSEFTLDVYDENETILTTLYGTFASGIIDGNVINNNTYIIDEYDYSNITENDIIDNAEFWGGTVKKLNEYDNVECKFRYNSRYPIYIIIGGDYSAASTPATVQFTEPAVIEDYTGYRENGNYPAPITNLVATDGSTSEINIPELETSDTIVLYGLPLDEDYGTNEDIAIRGLEVTGVMESNTDNLQLNCSLVNGAQESKQRSIVLDETNPENYEDNQFSIGQVGDLWGFKTNEITDLEDWEVHIQINNSMNQYEAIANFGDFYLIIYTEEITDQPYRIYVENEDLSYYGFFLQDVKIPIGLKTDVGYITVDGTDINDPYRQNIKEKTIEVEFSVDGCDLEASTLALREITRLLTNRRDKYNRPIPKRLEFSHYPDVFWEYIMEDSIDAEVEISGYKCKAKFIVAAGTSYDKQVTSTGNTGYVSGLASIRPVIQFSPTDNVISIREEESGQEFNMGYSGDWNNKIVEIDCDDRIVWLKESDDDTDPVNISQYVDINSDWFILNGEYEFTTVGCGIRSVDWQERW